MEFAGIFSNIDKDIECITLRISCNHSVEFVMPFDPVQQDNHLMSTNHVHYQNKLAIQTRGLCESAPVAGAPIQSAILKYKCPAARKSDLLKCPEITHE